MVILGAVAAAIGWGTSDYVGGHASKRGSSVFAVVAVSELLGVLLLLPVLVARGVALPGAGGLLLAVAAGLTTTTELGLVYRALSRGNTFVTAPVGSLGAAIAVVVGVIAGDQLTVVIGLGLACALLGGMVSTWSSPTAIREAVSKDLAICLGAAASIGATLALLHAAGRVDPVWVTATQHASTGASAGLIGAFGGRGSFSRSLFGRRQLAFLVGIAVAGTAGDLGYVGAAHGGGALSIVSAISSLYPVTTIILGRANGGAKATRTQLVGVTVALTGAMLLGAASP